jgi:hypothetical protein
MRTRVTCGYDRTRVQSAAREGRCPRLYYQGSGVTWSVAVRAGRCPRTPPGAQRRRSGAQRRTFTPFALPPSLNRMDMRCADLHADSGHRGPNGQVTPERTSGVNPRASWCSVAACGTGRQASAVRPPPRPYPALTATSLSASELALSAPAPASPAARRSRRRRGGCEGE